MIGDVLSLPILIGAPIVMLATSVVGMSAYTLSHRWIEPHRSEDLTEATSSLFRVVGILLSLFLSITFADVIVELNAIETAIERETLAIADIHADLERFGLAETEEPRRLLIAYTRSVIEDDWPALADDRLGDRT